MTVYVVQAMKGRDYSDAKNYGEVKVLMGAEDQIYYDRAKPLRELRKRLGSFNPEQDFLLLSGDPVAIGIATACIAKRLIGSVPVNFLKWDRLDSRYNVVTICL